MSLRSPCIAMLAMVLAGPLLGQSGERVRPIPPGYGSLTQNDVTLGMQSDELEIRFVPLDPRIFPLLATDTYQSYRNLVEQNRRGIDSVASRAGVSQPGLALVSFFGRRPDVRFDAQTLTLLIRNRVFRPLGLIPLTPRFTSQQLGVREQVSAIYLFEEELPVEDSFVVSYGAMNSDDWQSKQQRLNGERARIAARSRGAAGTTARDTTR